jgi:hypothetical protein
MSARGVLLATGLVVAVGLAACGERPQVIEYKQGTYQGKADQPPFAGAPWNGNQTEWNTAIRTRNQYQNEYQRLHD